MDPKNSFQEGYKNSQRPKDPLDGIEEMSKYPDIESNSQCPMPNSRTAPGGFPKPMPSPFGGRGGRS
jgi:hypothetical protein